MRLKNLVVLGLMATGVIAASGLIAPPSATSLIGISPNAAITATPNPALVNQTVNFDGSGSTGDGAVPASTITNYKWDLDGNGSFEVDTGTVPTTSSSYVSPATIIVTLQVTDSEGDIDADSVSLKVHRPPVATFTIAPPAPLANQTFTLDGSASNDPDGPIAAADHDWDLDNDGAFDDAEGPIVTHSFPDVGNHTVRLRVVDADGAATVDTQVVRVNAPPTAGFILEPSTPSAGELVTFSSTSSDPEGAIPTASQRWDFDADGQFDDATGQTVTHIFSAPATVQVGLEVTDSDGATTIATRSVVVKANTPGASFTFSPTAPQTRETVSFDGSGSTPPAGEAITSMTWDLDDDGDFNDATGPTASTSYRNAGPHNVRLRVGSTDGGSDIVSKLVRVGDRGPTASFDVTPKSPTAGDRVALTSTSSDEDGPIVDETWDLDGDGQYDDATGPTAKKTFAGEGTFTVGLKVRDADDATDEATRTITVESRALELLTPFPVVRLAGAVNANGQTKIDRLTVHAPRGSDVTVRCHGDSSCPFRKRDRTVKRNRVRFPGIERLLNHGNLIEIFVTKGDLIGKYTSFKLRANKAPERTDSCLEGESNHPVRCPRL